MKLRYKNHPETIRDTDSFNMCSLCEIDMGDDSASISDLDVEIDGVWMDLRDAFAQKLVVPDNYNRFFGRPVNEECRERGYNP